MEKIKKKLRSSWIAILLMIVMLCSCLMAIPVHAATMPSYYKYGTYHNNNVDNKSIFTGPNNQSDSWPIVDGNQFDKRIRYRLNTSYWWGGLRMTIRNGYTLDGFYDTPAQSGGGKIYGIWSDGSSYGVYGAIGGGYWIKNTHKNNTNAKEDGVYSHNGNFQGWARWNFTRSIANANIANGNYVIATADTSKKTFLDISGNAEKIEASTDNTPGKAEVWNETLTDTGSGIEIWNLTSNGSGGYHFRIVGTKGFTNYYLDLPGATTSNGNQLQAWKNGGQVYYLKRDTGYTGENMYLQYNDRWMVDRENDSYSDGSAVKLHEWNGTAAQLWRPVMVVKYNPNDGTGAVTNTGAVSALGYTVKAEPTRLGYTFKNWNTKKNGQGTSYAAGSTQDGLIQENQKERSITRVLYAQWTPNQYIITLDPNGQSGKAVSQNYTWDDEFTFSQNPFNNGKALVSWNTKADGTGVAYMPGEDIHSPVDENGKPVTKLYAQWLPSSVTIKYDANGGSFLPEEKTTNTVVYAWDGISTSNPTLAADLTKGASYRKPSRDGYRFVGWKLQDGTNFNGGDTFTATSTKSNLTATAVWQDLTKGRTLPLENGAYVVDNDKLKNIVIKKLEAGTESKGLAGATLELQKKGSNGTYTTVARATTDVNGNAAFKNLAYGKYKIVETKAPQGYEMNTKGWNLIIVSKEETNAPFTYTLKNLDTNKTYQTNNDNDLEITDSKAPDIVFTKKDLSSEGTITGGSFELVSSSGKSYGKASADSNGQIRFTSVPTGIYTLKELAAPSGYALYDKGWYVKVTLNTSGKKEVTVKLNAPSNSADSLANALGKLNDTKTYTFNAGDEMKGINVYNESKPQLHLVKVDRVNNKSPIVHATFTLSLADGSGEPVTLTTDKNGVLDINSMQKNVDYTLKETSAPSSHLLSHVTWNLNWDGTKVNITPSKTPSSYDTGKTSIPSGGTFAPIMKATDRETPKNPIYFYKVDGTTKQPLSGAKFRILSESEYKAYKEYVQDNDLTATKELGVEAVSNNNGIVEVPKSCLNGEETTTTYYVVETQAPSGYGKCDDMKLVIRFNPPSTFTPTLTYVKDNSAVGKNATGAYQVPDYQSGALNLIKKDSASGKSLGNAHFTLTGKDIRGNDVKLSNTSDVTTGELTIDGIPEGYNYTLTEDEAPNGYALPRQTWHVVSIVQNSASFTRSDNQTMTLKKGTYLYDSNWNLVSTTTSTVDKTKTNYVITNQAAAALRLKKVDGSASTETRLDGAVFTMTGVSGNAVGYKQTSTTEEGLAGFTSLLTGTYTLKETQAPYGYQIPKELQTGYTVTVTGTKNSDVTITSNGKTINPTGTDNLFLGSTDDPCKEYTISDQLSEMTLTKKITGEYASPTTLARVFTFNISLTNTSHPTFVSGVRKFGDVTFTNGTATVTLKNDQTVHLKGIPAGTQYVVTETDSHKMKSTIINGSGTVSQTQTTAIRAENESTDRKPVDLILSKDLTDKAKNLSPYKDDTFNFTVTLKNLEPSKTYSATDGKTFTSDASGNATYTASIKAGQSVTIQSIPKLTTYQITEAKSARNGYKPSVKITQGSSTVDNETGTLNTALAAKTQTIGSDGAAARFTNDVVTGYTQLTKVSSLTNMTNNNSQYDVKGAEYTIYKDGKCQTSTGKVLTVGADGKTNIVELDLGTYYVKETKAGTGYQLDSTVYPITITPDYTQANPLKVGNGGSVKDTPHYYPVKVVLQKADMESKQADALGIGSLKNAEYKIDYYDKTDHSGLHKLLMMKTDEKGQITLDLEHTTSDTQTIADLNFFKKDDKTFVLPAGYYTIKETKPSDGYTLDKETHSFTVKQDGTISGSLPNDITKNAASYEQAGRTNIKFKKINDETREAMAGIPFEIRRVDAKGKTIEKHTIVTDANGIADTSKGSRDSDHVNKGRDSNDGVWFGETTPRTTLGALVSGSYEVEELRCAGNKGMNVISFTFTISNGEVVSKDMKDLGTYTNMPIKLKTSAKNKETGTKIMARNDNNYIEIIDTVTYSGLTKGEKYEIKGTLMDKKTNMPYLDYNGHKVTSSVTFTPTSSSGTQDVLFTFQAESLNDTHLTVFEDLYQRGVVAQVHEDINDQDQSVEGASTLMPMTGGRLTAMIAIIAGGLCLTFFGVKKLGKRSKEEN